MCGRTPSLQFQQAESASPIRSHPTPRLRRGTPSEPPTRPVQGSKDPTALPSPRIHSSLTHCPYKGLSPPNSSRNFTSPTSNHLSGATRVRGLLGGWIGEEIKLNRRKEAI